MPHVRSSVSSVGWDCPRARPQPARDGRPAREFLEALDLEEVTVVANDTGGAVVPGELASLIIRFAAPNPAAR
jgi:hypothetical protein